MANTALDFDSLFETRPAEGSAPPVATLEPLKSENAYDIAFELAPKYGVPTDVVKRLIDMESGGNPYAIGPKTRSGEHAMGVMQLMPDRARILGVRDAFNARENIDGGLRFLKENYNQFGRWDYAVAAYHAGPGAVKKANGIPDTNDRLSTIADYTRAIAGDTAPSEQAPDYTSIFNDMFETAPAPGASPTLQTQAVSSTPTEALEEPAVSNLPTSTPEIVPKKSIWERAKEQPFTPTGGTIPGMAEQAAGLQQSSAGVTVGAKNVMSGLAQKGKAAAKIGEKIKLGLESTAAAIGGDYEKAIAKNEAIPTSGKRIDEYFKDVEQHWTPTDDELQRLQDAGATAIGAQILTELVGAAPEFIATGALGGPAVQALTKAAKVFGGAEGIMKALPTLKAIPGLEKAIPTLRKMVSSGVSFGAFEGERQVTENIAEDKPIMKDVLKKTLEGVVMGGTGELVGAGTKALAAAGGAGKVGQIAAETIGQATGAAATTPLVQEDATIKDAILNGLLQGGMHLVMGRGRPEEYTKADKAIKDYKANPGPESEATAKQAVDEWQGTLKPEELQQIRDQIQQSEVPAEKAEAPILPSEPVATKTEEPVRAEIETPKTTEETPVVEAGEPIPQTEKGPVSEKEGQEAGQALLTPKAETPEPGTQPAPLGKRSEKRVTIESKTDDIIAEWDKSGVSKDLPVEQRRQMAQEAAVKATAHDVTNLPSRAEFNSKVDQVEQRPTENTTPLYIEADVDRFKMFNDNFGHEFGDEVLRKTIPAANALFKKEGIAHFHKSGDEHAGIIEVPKGQEAAFLKKIKRIKKQIEEVGVELPDGKIVPVRMTFAVSSKPGTADIMLKDAKKTGGVGRGGLAIDKTLEAQYNIKSVEGVDILPEYKKAGMTEGVRNEQASEVSGPAQREEIRQPDRTDRGAVGEKTTTAGLPEAAGKPAEVAPAEKPLVEQPKVATKPEAKAIERPAPEEKPAAKEPPKLSNEERRAQSIKTLRKRQLPPEEKPAAAAEAKAETTPVAPEHKARVEGWRDRIVGDKKERGIEVVEDEAAIAEKINKANLAPDAEVHALYDPQSKKIFVVAKHMRNARDVERAIKHEAFHRGSRDLYHYVEGTSKGAKMRKAWAQIADALPETERNRIARDYLDGKYDPKNDDHVFRVVDEVLANRSAKQVDPNLIKRAYAFIRKVLRDMGLNLKWSDDDIAALVRRSRERGMRKPKGEGTGKAAAQLDTESEEALRDVMRRYEDGELTERDVYEEAKTIVEDSNSPELEEAIRKYEDDLAYDRELKGRGDMDTANDELLAAIRKELGEEPTAMLKPDDINPEEFDALKDLGEVNFEEADSFDGWKKKMLADVGEIGDDQLRAVWREVSEKELDKFAGNIRLSKYDGSKEFDELLQENAKNYEAYFKDRKRGVIKDAVAQEMADRYGMDEKRLFKRKRGEAFNEEKILAARSLLKQSSERVLDLREKLREKRDAGKLTEEDLVEFNLEMRRNAAIQAEVGGITAEAGRSLRALKFMVEAKQKAAGVKALLEEAGGRDINEAILDKLIAIDPENVPAVSKFIRKSMFAKTTDAIFEAWISALLSAPKTHIVNVSSNLATLLYRTALERPAAAIVERGLVSKLQHRPAERFVGESAAEIYGILGGLGDAVNAMKYTFKTGMSRYGGEKIEHKASQDAIPGKAGKLIRTPLRALAAEDEFFKTLIYRATLRSEAYRRAKIEKLKGKDFTRRVQELLDNPTDPMRENALKEADYRTFTKPLGKTGQKLMAVRNSFAPLKVIFPFVKTPTNIAKFALERMPVTSQINLTKKLMRGEIKGAEIADEAAKGMVGAILAFTTVMLAKQGLITGGGPKDKGERDTLYRTGWQPYSMLINDRYYSFARLEPLGSILGISADLATMPFENADDEKKIAGIAEQLSLAIGKNITSKTFMTGLSNTLDAIQDPTRYGKKWYNSFVGSLIPSIVAAGVRATDTQLKDIRDAGDQLRARSPGLSKTVPVKRDLWGQPIEASATGGKVLGFSLESFFSPVATSEKKNDAVDEEMKRIGVSKVAPTNTIQIIGKKIKLDDEEYAFYQKTAGEKARKDVERELRTGRYRSLSDDEKKESIDRIIENARREAKVKVLAMIKRKRGVGSNKALIQAEED